LSEWIIFPWHLKKISKKIERMAIESSTDLRLIGAQDDSIGPSSPPLKDSLSSSSSSPQIYHDDLQFTDDDEVPEFEFIFSEYKKLPQLSTFNTSRLDYLSNKSGRCKRGQFEPLCKRNYYSSAIAFSLNRLSDYYDERNLVTVVSFFVF